MDTRGAVAAAAMPEQQVLRLRRARGVNAPRVLQGACLPDGRSASFAVQSAARGAEATTYTVSLRGGDGSWACTCPDGRRHDDTASALLCKHVVCVVEAAGLDYARDVWAGGRQRLDAAACAPDAVRAMVARLRVEVPREALPVFVRRPAGGAAAPAAPPPPQEDEGEIEEAPLEEGADDDPCAICMLHTVARFVGSGKPVPLQACAGCRKQNHARCAAQWVASRRALGMPATCPWCRARM